MAAPIKNPAVRTHPFSASLCQYQIDAIIHEIHKDGGKKYRTQSSVIRAAIDQFLKLKRPPEYIETPAPKTRKKK